MKIDISAFKNCVSLKEIDLSKVDEPVFIGFLPSDNIPNDTKIVIPDKLYDKWLDVELPCHHKKIKKYSEKIQDKINDLEKSNILQAYNKIILATQQINNIKLQEILKNITKQLLDMYNINKEQLDYFYYLYNKKEDAKNGRR